MMRKVKNLKPGDTIVQDGIKFVVHTVALWGDNQVSIAFDDMPETEVVRKAFIGLHKRLMRDADCGAVAMGRPGWFMRPGVEVKCAGGPDQWWARSASSDGRKQLAEVAVVVERGMVSEVYSNVKGLLVDVIDTDTDDPGREEEIKENLEELRHRVELGELAEVY